MGPRGMILGAAVVLGIAGGVRAFVGSFSRSDVASVVVRPARFVREVIATGTLKAVSATPIVVPAESGREQKVSFIAPDGAVLKAGDLVVEFDPFEARREEADGRSDLAAAEAKMEKVTAEGSRTSRSLSIDQGVAREEMERAGTFELSDESLFSKHAVIESRIDSDFSARRADLAGRKIEANGRVSSSDRALSNIEAGKARLKIENAEKGLRSLRIVAPHAGVLVLQKDWSGRTVFVGSSVWPGQKIAEIPDLTSLEARVFVLEADAAGLEPGLAARVTIEGRPGPDYPAKVSRVEALAKPREWQSPVKYFDTALSLERTDSAALNPGQRVRAVIRLEEIASAMAVPRGCLFEKDGARVVYRERGGRYVATPVKLGANSISRVVIESGLEPGDRIALRDPTAQAAAAPPPTSKAGP
jgi:HlyD family secretion protein